MTSPTHREPPPTAAWDSRRADARRNHERVLAAAVEVFTEFGLDATIPQVAARAGVGKATVYRSYPTKADLVRALAQTHVDEMKELAAQALEEAQSDAFGALGRFLSIIVTRLAEDRLLVEVLKGGDVPEDPEGDAFFGNLIELGISQGSLRADATATDVKILLSGFAHTLVDHDIRDAEIWRRYAMLTMAALRP
jgi:AcrR family transcriptional regulator